MRKGLCFALMAALLMAGCTALQHEPIYHFSSGDYRDAANTLPGLAASGNAEAETDLGYMYQYGLGVPQDENHALGLYKQAATQGYAPGESALGVLLVQGNTVPHDYAQAIKLFETAMKQGYNSATGNLAFMYYEGVGVPKDEDRAKSLGSAAGQIPEMSRYALWMRNTVITRMYYFNNQFHEYAQPAIVSFSVINGRAANIQIVRSSGSAIIDADLTQAVSEASFPPAPLGNLTPSTFRIQAAQ